MKRHAHWLCFAAALGVLLRPAPGPSADEPKNAAAAEVVVSEAIALLHEADHLADAGERHKSPEMFVAAGSLMLKLKELTDNKMQVLEVAPEVRGPDGKPIANAKVETRKLPTYDALAQEHFDRALSLGNDLKVVKEVAAMVKAAKTRSYEETGKRGAVGGPKLFTRTLGPKQTHSYNLTFDVLTPGAVAFQANFPTRCQMRNECDVPFNQVVRTGQYQWQPQPQKPIKVFNVEISNPNNHPVSYRLATN